MLTVGDKVVRKQGRQAIGTIEAICGNRARVCWTGALRLIGGGTENHTTVLVSSLLPATQARPAAAPTRPAYHYCTTCKHNMFDAPVCCRCDRAAWEAWRAQQEG
jgi:hypothetical protein